MDPAALASGDPMTQALIEAAKAAYEAGGWAAVAGAGLIFFIRGLRMTDSGSAWWDALTLKRKRAWKAGTVTVGTAILMVSLGKPIIDVASASLVSGAVAAFVAGLGHAATERFGARFRLTGNPKLDAALRMAFGDGVQDAPPGGPGPAEPPEAPAP